MKKWALVSLGPTKRWAWIGDPDGAGARVILQPDGTFLIRHGASDIGQGSEEVMEIIVAQLWGCLWVRSGYTLATPNLIPLGE